MFQIYTDGACDAISKRGGWAALVIGIGDRQLLQGREAGTTSNRMEITAAMRGLAHTPEGAEVAIYSDSQYLVGTMSRKWKRNANQDLWQEMDALAARRRVSWEWVRGHSAHPENEEVHRAAEAMASGKGAPSSGSGQRPSAAAAAPPSPGVRMVDISEKPVTERQATARATVNMAPATLERIAKGEVAKGDVLTAARLAGVLAAKQTPHLIPLCHPLLMDTVEVDCIPRPEKGIVEVTASVAGSGRTGYEMEALTAAAVATLTIYDMCKAYDPAMKIELALLSKSGGKSGRVKLGVKDET